jgi:hypothetical protein
MNDLFPDAPIPLEAQIACVEREIVMRRRVYPEWIAKRRMTGERAQAEIRAMSAVLKTLRELRPGAASVAAPPASSRGERRP